MKSGDSILAEVSHMLSSFGRERDLGYAGMVGKDRQSV